MACVKNLCRVSLPKIYNSLYHSKKPRTINTGITCTSLALSRSNHILCVGNSVRWNYQMFNYSTNVKDTEQPSVASQLAQDLLAAKIKEESNKEGSVAQASSEEEEKQKEKDKENARRALRFSFVTVGFMVAAGGGALVFRWGAPPEDEFGRIMEDELTDLPIVEQYLRRTYREMKVMNTMIQQPSREKLLPDELSGQYIQPPYTLVLEMKDVLVHPEWTYQTGWRFKKRPGLDFLLQHCAPPLFEIVIYTNEQGFTAFPVIDKLDPNGFIWYRLFKDSTHYVNGKHMKELNLLNRDLKKVIMVDWDAGAVSCTRNQLRIRRWDGNMDDKGLVQLGFLLRTIADSEVEDVREVLDYYRLHDDPLAAYEQFQTQAAEQDELRERAKDGQGKTATGTWSPSFIKKWQ